MVEGSNAAEVIISRGGKAAYSYRAVLCDKCLAGLEEAIKKDGKWADPL